MLGISEAAEQIGFRTIGVKISFEQLVKDVPFPCIVHWKQNHFVVVYDISRKAGEQKSGKAGVQESRSAGVQECGKGVYGGSGTWID
jgi:ABC-type bacteriocin/lantibiotic exporter with double-glycine peptidase domain